MSTPSTIATAKLTLAADRYALRAAVDRVPAAMREHRVAPDRWSVAEVIEHLGIVEARVVMFLSPLIQTAPTLDGPEDVGGTPIVRARLRDRTTRIEAPAPIQPSGTMSAETAWATLEDTRVKLLAMLDAAESERRNLAHVTRPHPVLGLLDGYQWIAAVGGHEERHTLQILEIADALPR